MLQATDAICVCNQQQEYNVLIPWKEVAFVAWSENVGDVKINLCLSTQWKEQKDMSGKLHASAALPQKRTAIPTDNETGWALDPVSTVL